VVKIKVARRKHFLLHLSFQFRSGIRTLKIKTLNIKTKPENENRDPRARYLSQCEQMSASESALQRISQDKATEMMRTRDQRAIDKAQLLREEA